jgi:hypothetical protein
VNVPDHGDGMVLGPWFGGPENGYCPVGSQADHPRLVGRNDTGARVAEYGGSARDRVQDTDMGTAA